VPTIQHFARNGGHAFALPTLRFRLNFQTAAFPRHDVPELCIIIVPRRQREQGMPARQSHPQPCVQVKKARKQVTTGTPKRRHSLHDGLTAYTCSPWCTGLFSHHRSTIRLAELDPSVGRSGPHDFAVRAGRARLARQHVHRIPRPTSVTIAIRPSCGCETCGLGPLICPTAQAMLPATD
jgi:hypothetical protein